MPYDFSAAVAAAKAVVENSNNSQGGGTNRYPIVYPTPGNIITVRLLFNPASGQIVRLINRHEKTVCYKTYNTECPICKVMQEVKNTTGSDPFGRTKGSRCRGISYCQFISSTSPITKSDQKTIIQPGEPILFMYPWSVYTQINALIQAVAQTPTGMDQAFSHADSGLFVQISTSADYKYTTTSVPYMTFTSGRTDDDFTKMLEGMPSLNEELVPSQINESTEKQVKEYADAIYRQFIAPKTPQMTPQTPVPNQMIPPQFAQTNPMSTGVPYPTTPSSAVNAVPTSSAPQCMGHHDSNNVKCIACPAELTCISSTNPDDSVPF